MKLVFQAVKKSFSRCITGMMVLSCLSVLGADVKSTSGNIKFHVDALDASPEMTLNTTGLAIGGHEPSENLDVRGDVVITTDLQVGGTHGSSNLSVHGTMSQSTGLISSSTNLNPQHSIYLLDSSSGNLEVGLPDTSDLHGRVLLFKRISSSSNVTILGGNSTIDGYSQFDMSVVGSELPSLKLMATSGNLYHVMDAMGSVTGSNGVTPAPSLTEITVGWDCRSPDGATSASASNTSTGFTLSSLTHNRDSASIINDGRAIRAYRITSYDSAVEDYIEFSISKDSGVFNLKSISFNIRKQNNTSPTFWDLRSSVDGYASSLHTASMDSGSPPRATGPFDLSSISGQSSVVFRLYGTSGGAGGFYSINDIMMSLEY